MNVTMYNCPATDLMLEIIINTYWKQTGFTQKFSKLSVIPEQTHKYKLYEKKLLNNFEI